LRLVIIKKWVAVDGRLYKTFFLLYLSIAVEFGLFTARETYLFGTIQRHGDKHTEQIAAQHIRDYGSGGSADKTDKKFNLLLKSSGC
jgi:hypothetical protein